MEIDNDIGQQEREWVMQRIGWVLLAMLLASVTAGLFGRGGPLSTVKAATEDGFVRLEYDRFMRYHSPDSLRVIIEPTSDSVKLKMDRQYASQIQIDRITPEPEREIGDDQSVTFVFNSRSDTKLHATFHFAPMKYGKLQGWLAVEGGQVLPLRHFVYP